MSSTASDHPSTPADADRLLHHWEQRARLALYAYNRAASRGRTFDALLGGTTAVLAAAIGTAVFATLKEDVGLVARLVVASVSVTAAILAALQTFAAMPARVEEYEKAARRFAALRRELELLRLRLPSMDPAEMHAALAEVCVRLEAAANASINAPRRVWDKVRRHIKGEYTRWERLIARIKGLPDPRPLVLVERTHAVPAHADGAEA